MDKVWSERVFDVTLLHYVDSSYQGPSRTDRYRTQAVQLTRPSGAVYSITATITCAVCGDDVSYQVLSLLASRLRWTLWTVLALASTAAAVWGVVVLFTDDRPVAQGEDPPGVWYLMIGLALLGVFALLLITEIGISGPGARRTARPHTLQLITPEPDTGALTCEQCGHQEPLDGGGYARMKRHRCQT